VVDVRDPTHPVAAITFDPQVQDVQEIAFHPDGHTALIGGSGSDDVPTVAIWDLASPTRPTRLGSLRRKQAGGLDALAVSPDGTVLASADVGGQECGDLLQAVLAPEPLDRDEGCGEDRPARCRGLVHGVTAAHPRGTRAPLEGRPCSRAR